MKYLLSLAALAATCTALAQGNSEAILSYSANIGGFVTATAGWTFQTTNSLAVTELGCFAKVFEDDPGIGLVQVGLWDDNGLLLASNSISPASMLYDQTRYEAITPVSLSPGQVYHLGVYYPGSGFGLDVAGPTTSGSVSVSPVIQVTGIALANAGFASPATVSGTAGSIYAGPNFQFLAQPILMIQPWTGNQVRLSWSNSYPDYTLQSKLGLSGTWANAGLSVSTVGSEFVAFDSIGAGPNFYRLIK